MKRKTNLFYNGINDLKDNKFITFSNYTESLTGNFLSTNTKLFPSRFFCLYINGLNENNKASFINILMTYYENKLAVLRDFITSENKNCEHNILPLNYLLEMLESLRLENDTWIFDQDNTEKCYKIVYFDDITEQDYNGTFADTIYIVKLSDHIFEGEIVKQNDTTGINEIRTNTINSEILYGWEYNRTFEFIKNLKPIYDKKEDGTADSYRINSDITAINLIKRNFNSTNSQNNELTFNIIVPLYDIVDINYKNPFNNIEVEYRNDDDGTMKINLIDSINTNNNLYIKNVPLGMWFADEPITLKRDVISGNSQTWSLTVSSQFKPFPYSKQMPEELGNSGISNAYATFAEVLSKQNSVIDKFTEIIDKINDINKRLSNLENNINNIGTTYNIDGLHKEIISLEQNVDNKINNMKLEVLDIMSNIKWKSTI